MFQFMHACVARAIGGAGHAGPLASVVCLGLLAGCATGAGSSEAHYRNADFATVRKFDAHVHANVAAPEILEQARVDGFELLSINVDYPDFPRLADQQAAALTLVRMDPARLHFATTFSMEGWGQPDWAARVNRQLDTCYVRTRGKWRRRPEVCQMVRDEQRVQLEMILGPVSHARPGLVPGCGSVDTLPSEAAECRRGVTPLRGRNVEVNVGHGPHEGVAVKSMA